MEQADIKIVKGFSSLFYGTALIAFALDQVSKAMVRAMVPLEGIVPVVPGYFQIRHTVNPGAAFGLFPDAGPFLVGVAIIACWLFLRIGRRGFPKRRLAVSFGMMLGGAVGNLTDRLFRGAVTDFLDFVVWPVFNLADTFLTLGAFGAIVWSLKGEASSS
ncbi:MAG: signal peptidase II [Armatimonadetes bacterium]|nr:signal peptidase II [Armatimonadota bacterium]MDW8122921.1 signal peptidase II [Armatimonadota bacterium]